VFAVLYAAAIALRVSNPDLWAPGYGGEKPMDFAILNAVVHADAFPPPDPWFAGGRLNYYYGGFVPVAALAKLTGTPAAVATNLAVALWMALTGSAFARPRAHSAARRRGTSRDAGRRDRDDRRRGGGQPGHRVGTRRGAPVRGRSPRAPGLRRVPDRCTNPTRCAAAGWMAVYSLFCTRPASMLACWVA
jgi:hypothetical protein